jgi:Tfp pilus assembly protein PilF
MPGGRAAAFLALRDLADSFVEVRSERRKRELRSLAASVGSVAIPLCLRQLGGSDADHRAWAAELLETIARGGGGALEARVLAELHRLAGEGGLGDDAKVSVLSLLAELGQPTTAASFRDPGAIQRRSLGELADLLTCRPDVALAADLLVTQLDPDALIDFVDALTQAAPARARHLVDELLVRTDLDAAMRGELVRIAAPLALIESEPLAEGPRRRPRILCLRHPGGRLVVITMRRTDAGTTRCLVLLVDNGELIDGLYRDDATRPAIDAELLAPLYADGYQPVSERAASVRELLVDAARTTIAAGDELPSAYFLGRDLLDLGDAHQPARWQPDVPTTLLGRAVDLLSAGEPERARPLLERCVDLAPDDSDAAASLGLCLLSNGDLEGARRQLERAARLEPAWPLHVWNLAAVAHRQGRIDACYVAMRRFLDLSRAPGALAADPDQPARVELATRFVADHERLGRLERPPRATASARRPRRRAGRGIARR